MKPQHCIILAFCALTSACVTDRQSKNIADEDGRSLAGAVLGGAAGAVVGHQSGRTGEGAVVGAAVGGAVGGKLDEDDRKKRAQNVKNVGKNRADHSQPYEKPGYPATPWPGPVEKYNPRNYLPSF